MFQNISLAVSAPVSIKCLSNNTIHFRNLQIHNSGLQTASRISAAGITIRLKVCRMYRPTVSITIQTFNFVRQEINISGYGLRTPFPYIIRLPVCHSSSHVTIISRNKKGSNNFWTLFTSRFYSWYNVSYVWSVFVFRWKMNGASYFFGPLIKIKSILSGSPEFIQYIPQIFDANSGWLSHIRTATLRSRS
jgi:hypothetical protein